MKVGAVRLNDSEKWFPFKTYEFESDDNRTIVFCFHHAGGSASSYRKWTAEKGRFNFVCVELPGKGTRRKEKFIIDFKRMLEDLTGSILKVACQNDIIFFGHSMGAAMAFYTASYMNDVYGVSPKKIVVAGRQAPNEENLIEFKSYMGDSALVDELKRYKATPTEILENKEILEFILPEVRRDYQLNESFIYSGQVLEIPLIIHAGKNDIEANLSVMNRWNNVTRKEVKSKEFNGDHFFIFDTDIDYFHELINDLLEEV